MPDTTAIIRQIKRNAIAVHGDDERYKCRFDVPGSTGDIHRISFDSAPGAGYWKCSCRGCIRHGHCKHLTSCGLPGRSSGKSLKWTRYFAN
jgi:hypothetical protein